MATVKDVERYRELLKYKWRCDAQPCDGMPHKNMPHKHARTTQLVPDSQSGGSYIHALITGRGFGKTRAAAEFVKDRMMKEPGHRVNVIAQTFGHGRDLCIEGESGLIACLPDGYVNNYNRSLGELNLRNGSQLKIFGSHTKDDAESIRGSQSHTVWAEELAYWRQAQLAWNNAMFANRLGEDPRVVVTATPRATSLMRWLLAENKERPEFVHIQGGSTFENQSNLAKPFLEHLVRTYQNTRLGAQELEGLMLDDIAGALLSRDLIQYATDIPDLVRIVVAVDPPGGHRPSANAECGLVVVGKSADGFLYLLADKSGYYTPEQWAGHAIELYDYWMADVIVAEVNYGGAMVQAALRAYSKHPNFKMVSASRGKLMRAEPVVNLFEQKRIFHVGDTETYKELENQWCTWVPPGRTERDEHGIETELPSSSFSPDRVDAEVWAITELALQPVRSTARMTCRPSKHMQLRSY